MFAAEHFVQKFYSLIFFAITIERDRSQLFDYVRSFLVVRSRPYVWPKANTFLCSNCRNVCCFVYYTLNTSVLCKQLCAPEHFVQKFYSLIFFAIRIERDRSRLFDHVRSFLFIRSRSYVRSNSRDRSHKRSIDLSNCSHIIDR